MNQETTNQNKPSTGITPRQKARARLRSWLPAIVLFAAFSAGFVPTWLRSSRLAGELHQTQQELRRTQLQITLAYAALDARRGDYETARQEAAKFFSLLTAELDSGVGSALPSGARIGLQPLLAQRDDLITLLARGDPASVDRMANASASFRKTLNPE